MAEKNKALGPGWWLAFGLLGGLIIAGVFQAWRATPRGEAIELRPAPSAAPIVVQVSGAVQAPGSFSLALGSRVQDALQAAGGANVDADVSGLNLAEPLRDGEQVDVPTLAPTPSPTPSFPININLASAADLERLPGIGPTLAQGIINYRESHGFFITLEQLMNVSGIGPLTFAAIEPYITLVRP
jgi:competence protein ComEA